MERKAWGDIMAIGLRAVGAAAALALGLGLAGTAQAATLYGSLGIGTVRPCDQAASEVCVNPPTVHRIDHGGLNQTVNASFDLGNGSSSLVSVGFGEAYMPVLKGAVTSADDQRVGSNVAGFRTYTYTGSESIDLALSANAHFVFSGDLLEGDAFGEGELNGILFITSTDFLTGAAATTSPAEPFTCMLSCVTDGFVAQGTSLGLVPGEHNVQIELAPYRLNPGDQFVVGALMQMFGNRGGYFNALNTFTVEVDDERSFAVGSTAPLDRGALLGAIASPIPEPATWTMMILGFGLAGGTLRRRQPATV